MDRMILHSDINACYASIELLRHPEHRARQRQLDITLDNLRARYGKTCVLRGRACFDPALGLVQCEEHAFLRK